TRAEARRGPPRGGARHRAPRRRPPLTVPRVRLASALLVPEPFAREIDGLRRALGENLDRVAPHLTLVPPVNVRVDEINKALSALRRAAAVMQPTTVTLGPAVTLHPV